MKAIGEVLSASITGFSAEAWRDESLPAEERSGRTQRSESNHRPSFGSFLKSVSEDRSLTVYGVVYDIFTGPQDQQHKPTALRMTRSELQREQPQIFSLLKTEWRAVIVGYKDATRSECGLPPYPPEVHDFVYPLDDHELIEASEDLEFLRMLSSAPDVPADELTAAVIRNAVKVRSDAYDYLLEAGRHLSKLLRDDYDRLASVLRRIKP